jgi:hypothetical protein
LLSFLLLLSRPRSLLFSLIWDIKIGTNLPLILKVLEINLLVWGKDKKIISRTYKISGTLIFIRHVKYRYRYPHKLKFVFPLLLKICQTVSFPGKRVL